MKNLGKGIVACVVAVAALAWVRPPRLTSGGQRPDFNNIAGCTPNATNPGNPNNCIKLQCFSFPAAGVLGNLGRNTLRGPGLEDLGFSIFKNWSFWQDKDEAAISN